MGPPQPITWTTNDSSITVKLLIKGAQTMKCKLSTETLEFSRLKMPNSRFALHGLAPPKFTVCAPFLPLIHGLCAFFRPLLTPLSTAPSPPHSQFTVCTSRFARCRFDRVLHVVLLVWLCPLGTSCRSNTFCLRVCLETWRRP